MNQKTSNSQFAYLFFITVVFWMSNLPLKSMAQSFQSAPPIPETPPPTAPLNPPENPMESQPTTPTTDREETTGSLRVKTFEFFGNTVFSQEQLLEVVKEFTGKEISFTQLLQAANKITELYIREGYITSGAYIPVQDFNSQSVKMQIVEGTLEQIKIEIASGRLKSGYVSSRINREISQPLNLKDLQEALQKLQLNPLIASLDAELSTGTGQGESILNVTVYGEKTFTITPTLNNNRNPSVGSFERGIEISEANLSGWGDGISLIYANTDGSDRFEILYDLPVNPQNGMVRLYYRNTDNEIIEPPFDELNITIDSRDYDLSFRQPIIENATSEGNQELAMGLGFARRESDSEVLGRSFPLSLGANDEGETRLSIIRFTQEWTEQGLESVFAARSQFNFGVEAFNATVNEAAPDSKYFLWRGQLLYLRLLSELQGEPAAGITMLLRSNFQLANNPILPLEQFTLGGQATVRGYRQDYLLTDSGVFASAEVRFPVLQVSEIEGILQIAPFIDFGVGWNNSGTSREDLDKNTLIGTGLALIWRMGDELTTRVDWGIPLVNVDSTKRTWQDNGFYFQIEYNFRPF
ncbi:MAG: ShlB/FhaC/HecB family hemolysin secretion/activation protein [Gomphosphaeria aponina SAG 52.96 = DSM 107014]|uniref:ShlB/FhaC/HecB family hemolysin secretion/activation protein n=1 Tax=Gomphosphaeria aponina SAG 52.96 = DSM 107014 TaxID=1521640 RepID=A0A941GN99_9CHRO|nr:ShlB/FhaC/HecB family hemolysin secretion/activation protein [Gomphosphaeria aponina SAG 52.96 = DSM 107014]